MVIFHSYVNLYWRRWCSQQGHSCAGSAAKAKPTATLGGRGGASTGRSKSVQGIQVCWDLRSLLSLRYFIDIVNMKVRSLTLLVDLLIWSWSHNVIVWHISSLRYFIVIVVLVVFPVEQWTLRLRNARFVTVSLLRSCPDKSEGFISVLHCRRGTKIYLLNMVMYQFAMWNCQRVSCLLVCWLCVQCVSTVAEIWF